MDKEMQEKLEKVNTELCEVIGIEPKEFCERTSDLCIKACPVYENRENKDYCFKYMKLLPRLYEPRNFVRLIETKIFQGSTLLGFLSIRGVYISGRYGFLLSLLLLLKIATDMEEVKETLRKQIWEYE